MKSSQTWRFCRLAITNGVMFLLVCACFGAVYGLRVVPWRQESRVGDVGFVGFPSCWTYNGVTERKNQSPPKQGKDDKILRCVVQMCGAFLWKRGMLNCKGNIMILLMEQILHQSIWRISHYLHGFIHPTWCRISPINSTMGLGINLGIRLQFVAPWVHTTDPCNPDK